MHDLPFKQIRDRRKTNVRVRPHLDTLPRRKFGRPHVIEKDERPVHLSLAGGQYTSHREAAEILCLRLNDKLDGPFCRGTFR